MLFHCWNKIWTGSFHFDISRVKGNMVKQSRYRPGVVQRVPGS
jgi:hypothetical protein